jgi:hypothetical protein
MREVRIYLLLFLSTCFVISSTNLFAQNMKPVNYTTWWKKIDSLIEKKGLHKSALTEVNKLFTAAVADKQEVQQVKALVYRLQLQETLEEFSDTLAITTFQEAAKTANPTSAAVLHALLASYYTTYYNNHRWELYGQTATRNFQKENIRSWGIEDFHQAINAEFDAALAQKQPFTI